MPQLMMFDDVGEICSSTSFKGTCHDQRWAAFFRCAETGCCHSIFARCRCCLILFCSSPLGLHYSQHACIESSVKLDAQLFNSSVKKNSVLAVATRLAWVRKW
jgi:hypothetical protein